MSVAAYNPKLVNVAFLDEATKGTVPTITTVNKACSWIYQDDLEILMPNPNLTPIYGGNNAPSFFTEEGRELKATLNYRLQNFQNFFNMFGKKTTSGAGPTYTHTFDTTGIAVANLPLPSFSMAMWFNRDGTGTYTGTTPNFDWCYAYGGCFLPNFKISGNEKSNIYVNADLAALNITNETAFPSGFSKITTQPFLMKKNTNLITIDGSAEARIMSFEVSVQRSWEYQYGDNGAYPTDIIVSGDTYQITTKFRAQDLVTLNKFLAASDANQTDIVLSMIGGGNSGTNTLTITSTSCIPAGKLTKSGNFLEATAVWNAPNIEAVGVDTNATYPI